VIIVAANTFDTFDIDSLSTNASRINRGRSEKASPPYVCIIAISVYVIIDASSRIYNDRRVIAIRV
jgi:hypothetical protein